MKNAKTAVVSSSCFWIVHYSTSKELITWRISSLVDQTEYFNSYNSNRAKIQLQGIKISSQGWNPRCIGPELRVLNLWLHKFHLGVDNVIYSYPSQAKLSLTIIEPITFRARVRVWDTLIAVLTSTRVAPEILMYDKHWFIMWQILNYA